MARNYDEKNVKLRTSLFGFKKKDVIHYLEKMNAAAEKERIGFIEASRDAQNFYIELSEADRRNSALTERINAIESENRQKDSTISKLTDDNALLRAENDKLKIASIESMVGVSPEEFSKAMSEKEAEIEALKAKLEAAEDDLKAAEKEADKLTEKVESLKARLRKDGKGGFRFPWW